MVLGLKESSTNQIQGRNQGVIKGAVTLTDCDCTEKELALSESVGVVRRKYENVWALGT